MFKNLVFAQPDDVAIKYIVQQSLIIPAHKFFVYP